MQKYDLPLIYFITHFFSNPMILLSIACAGAWLDFGLTPSHQRTG
jgi:hypothetical protein